MLPRHVGEKRLVIVAAGGFGNDLRVGVAPQSRIIPPADGEGEGGEKRAQLPGPRRESAARFLAQTGG